MVAKIKGQLVLLDGNHRAATAKLLGKPTIKAKVFDWS
jgi:ParB-like chromosome segregation protein Spo0J